MFNINSLCAMIKYPILSIPLLFELHVVPKFVTFLIYIGYNKQKRLFK